MKTIRITIDLEEELFKKFSHKCIDINKSKSAIVRDLIIEFLKK